MYKLAYTNIRFSASLLGMYSDGKNVYGTNRLLLLNTS
jgi:hypothetical protein